MPNTSKDLVPATSKGRIRTCKAAPRAHPEDIRLDHYLLSSDQEDKCGLVCFIPASRRLQQLKLFVSLPLDLPQVHLHLSSMRLAKAPSPSRPPLSLVPSTSPALMRPTVRFTNKAIRSSRPLLNEMRTLMQTSSGMGLSAPQVGLSQALSIVECLAEPELPNLQELPFHALFNPSISASSGRQEVWEGCLSLPGMMGLVARAEDVTVNFLDEEARPAQIRATGYLAALFQHELDHLNGKLYTQRLLDSKYFMREEEWRKHHPIELWNVKGAWERKDP